MRRNRRLLAMPASRVLLAGGAAAALSAAAAAIFIVWRRVQRQQPEQELWRLSAVDAVSALKEGRVTPEEMIESMLKRIEAVNGDINAVVTVCAQRAREKARKFAKAGGACGPLHGLPVLVKENQPIEGELWTIGQPAYATRIAPASHVIVQDLEAAGVRMQRLKTWTRCAC